MEFNAATLDVAVLLGNDQQQVGTLFVECTATAFRESANISPSGGTQFPTPFETVSPSFIPSINEVEDDGDSWFIAPVTIGVGIFAFLVLSAVFYKFKTFDKLFVREDTLNIELPTEKLGLDSERNSTLSGLPLGQSARVTRILAPRPESMETWYTTNSDNTVQTRSDVGSTAAVVSPANTTSREQVDGISI